MRERGKVAAVSRQIKSSTRGGNSNVEIRNPKQFSKHRKSEKRTATWRADRFPQFTHFRFVSDFGFRVSDFPSAHQHPIANFQPPVATRRELRVVRHYNERLAPFAHQ